MEEPSVDVARPDKMHAGTIAMQERFGTRELGARVARGVHARLSAAETAFVGTQEWFFLATADDTGRADCSFRAGPRGFVHVIDERTLAFEDYDGNGSFMSLGNLSVNPSVALLFIDFEHAKRLRVGGVAEVLDGADVEAVVPGAKRAVRIRVTHLHFNCPRHIPYLVKGVVPTTLPARINCWVRAQAGKSRTVRRVHDWIQSKV
jgi:predicted pyridoxine 5'-phosphate oxidase superfamily flavin-nucleotide-binding protein